MERVVVDDVFFVKRWAEVDDFDDDSVGDHESLSWEEFWPLLELVNLEFPPQFLVFIDSFIGEISWGRAYAHIVPNSFQFILFILRIPQIT